LISITNASDAATPAQANARQFRGGRWTVTDEEEFAP
jgi:hypothetical protein